MKVAIIPHIVELRVIVNPPKGATRERPATAVMPWMYAPWPDAQENGVAEMDVEGETLGALLTQVSDRYKQVNVDFEPINPGTNDLDFDYDVFLNGKNYALLPHGLNTELKDSDEVEVKMLYRWDG